MITHLTVELADIARGVRQMLHEHGLHEWRFEWDRAVKRAGCCHHATKRITLSWPIYSHTPGLDWSATALHEIAHAIAGPGNGHGARWRRIARDIGCDAQRCHSLPTPPTTVRGTCACDTPHSRVRMPKANYLCRNCRRRITWTRS